MYGSGAVVLMYDERREWRTVAAVGGGGGGGVARGDSRYKWTANNMLVSGPRLGNVNNMRKSDRRSLKRCRHARSLFLSSTTEPAINIRQVACINKYRRRTTTTSSSSSAIEIDTRFIRYLSNGQRLPFALLLPRAIKFFPSLGDNLSRSASAACDLALFRSQHVT